MIWKFWEKRSLVEFHFRSGKTVRHWFYSLDVTWEGNEIRSMKWNAIGIPWLFINISEIICIKQLKNRGWIVAEKL